MNSGTAGGGPERDSSSCSRLRSTRSAPGGRVSFIIGPEEITGAGASSHGAAASPPGAGRPSAPPSRAGTGARARATSRGTWRCRARRCPTRRPSRAAACARRGRWGRALLLDLRPGERVRRLLEEDDDAPLVARAVDADLAAPRERAEAAIGVDPERVAEELELLEPAVAIDERAQPLARHLRRDAAVARVEVLEQEAGAGPRSARAAGPGAPR